MKHTDPKQPIESTQAEPPAEPAAEPSRLDILIENSRDLPTIPKIAIQVAKLVDMPNTSASQVARALSCDQILTARVLRMANSAFYGAPRRISTVTDAIVLLGMRTIRNMAMAVSCFDVLDRELTTYAMRRGDMWRHAFCVGYAAQLLATRAHYRATEEAFVAGLMHDIGKVAISLHFDADFQQVSDQAAESDEPFYVIEQRVLGFDHAEVGARMTESWKLPQHLVETIRYHHRPADQEQWSALTAIVHVADVVCLTLGIGIGSDGLRYALEDGVIDRLGLSRESVEEVMILVSDLVATSDMMR
jgi:putative nucleotidyltransferase with HDIG domain